MRTILWYIAAALAGIAGLSLGLFFAVQMDAHRYIYALVAQAPTTTAAVILGASVYSSGTLSVILKERVDKAIELYRSHKVAKILMTGDNGALTHNEVEPVRRYLLAANVMGDDIFLDHAGFDTYSSMYRARDVFGVTSLTIVTQPFHLSRAVFIARTLGLSAYGVEAGVGEAYLYNYAREVPATTKAIFDLVFSRVPKYLGPVFPIGASGTSTWE
jgi:SanA protein